MKNSSSSILFLSLILFISLSSPLSARKPKCNPQEQEAIQEIRAALGLDPISDCCDWNPVVLCQTVPNQGTRVTSFFLNNFNSNVSTQFPQALAKLSYLDTLAIRSSSLSGPIPTSILKLQKLTELDLSFNNLNGSIPPELSQFPKLDTLFLQSNNLTGTIPESFGHFPESTNFFLLLAQNKLTGTVPKSLGNMNFSNVDLSYNKLTGDPTFLFQNKTALLDLNLSRNRFSFNLTNVEIPESLRGGQFDVSHNNIFGGIPQQWTQEGFSGLAFDVSYNKLCGPIPQGGNLQHMLIRLYSHNKCLCDAPLPPCK